MAAQGIGAGSEANQFSKDGIALMSEGQYAEAVKKFNNAARLDPKNPHYKTRLAEAWFFLQNFERAMEVLEPVVAAKRTVPEAFRIYGNCLDQMDKSYEALQVYRRGLKKFPNSGALYMEMGIVEFARNHDSEALTYWEQGIQVEPGFASNYYFAAKALLVSGDCAWAAIYAEAFVNLEQQGDRVGEMSQLLMQAYEKARVFDFEDAFRWRFYQVRDSGRAEKYGKTPAFHELLDEAFLSVLPDTAGKLSVASLGEIRRFVCYWLPKQLSRCPARSFFEWQQMVVRTGHFEAYNYWLLYDSRPEEFEEWYQGHEQQYNAFEAWYLRNPFSKYLKAPITRTVAQMKKKK